MKERVRYYNDVKNDDFFSFGKRHNKIKFDQNYDFIPKSKPAKFVSFCLYYMFAMPVLSFYMFAIQNVTIKGKENIKNLKNCGYMVVGNHTHYADAYLTQIGIARPKRTYIIADNNVVQLKFIGGIIKSLGAIPVPTTVSGIKKFHKTTSEILQNKQVITVFPEAHIWPYYTGLRPFPVSSFMIASKNKVPVVPVATTYKKRMFFKRPKAVIFVGKPIFFDNNLTDRQNAEYYRNMTFNFIKDKVSNNNYTYIKYLQKEKENENNFCNTQPKQT